MGELRRIPGIGAAGERDLLELGYTTIQSLAGGDPGGMYARKGARKGGGGDRGGRGVYRWGVYYAPTPRPGGRGADPRPPPVHPHKAHPLPGKRGQPRGEAFAHPRLAHGVPAVFNDHCGLCHGCSPLLCSGA